MSKVTEKDHVGRFFLRKKGLLQNMDCYFRSLIALAPFLRSDEWRLSTGYYINERYNSARLTYFTNPEVDLLSVVKSFIINSDFEYAKPPEQPIFKRVSDDYGGDELRFRRFLSIYSLIGLDLVTSDLLHARCLFATFRFQIMFSRSPYLDHFESSFQKLSTFYRSMSDEEKQQFWNDMSHWPQNKGDWAHMFVNMILGKDWNPYACLSNNLSIPDINFILLRDGMDFQIPYNWKPQID